MKKLLLTKAVFINGTKMMQPMKAMQNNANNRNINITDSRFNIQGARLCIDLDF